MAKPQTAEEALDSLDRFIEGHWPEGGDSEAQHLYLAEPVLWVMTEALHSLTWVIARAATPMPLGRKSVGKAAHLLRSCAMSLFIAARAGLQKELTDAKDRIKELERRNSDLRATLVEYRG